MRGFMEGRTVMSDSNVLDNADRRNFLGNATAGVAAAGVAAACWPFISSMNPSLDTLEKATTEVDLAVIQLGQTEAVHSQDPNSLSQRDYMPFREFP